MIGRTLLLGAFGKICQRCCVTERTSSGTDPKGKALQNEPWNITPLNWNVAFPRSPQHLSNQLRGKQATDQAPQLDLFENASEALSVEEKRELADNKVDVIGFPTGCPRSRP